MKVGEYLKSLLKRRRISIKQLSDSMGLVSRNELYRLFNGYHAYDKQKQLIDAIVKIVDFTEEETAQIYKLLEEYKDGEFAYEARQILMNIFVSDIKGYRAEHHGTAKKLTEMFQSRSGKKIILMHGIRDLRIIQDVYDYLKIRPNQTLYHYLRLPSEDVLTAYELLALIKLSAFNGYKPMLGDSNMPDGLYIVGKAANGAGYYQFIDFSEDKPRIIETPISDALHEYLTQKNNILEHRAKPFVKTVNSVHEYIGLLDAVPNLCDAISFESTPCFGYLSADILCGLFNDINDFGYTDNHEYSETQLNTVHKHWENLMSSRNRYIIFDKQHIEAFMQTGCSLDHEAGFPPLTLEQRIRYFEELIDLSLAHPENIHFRLLKEEYTIDYPFAYTKDNLLYMYRINTGYTDGSVITVDNKNAVETIKYFAKYVWEGCTLSDTESVSFLENLIREYTDNTV